MTSLSVVIPTRNRGDFLRRCLAAYRDHAGDPRLEVIVVDDGSSPEAARQNEEICRQVPNCQYLHRAQSQGAPSARNLGMRVSHGDFIWFMDDDDYTSSKAVEDILRAVEQVRCDNCMILLPMTIMAGNIVLKEVMPVADHFRFEWLRRVGQRVNTSCAVFARAILDRVGGWDERLLSGQDTDLFLRASREGTWLVVDTDAVVVEWQHPARITRSVYRQQIGKIQFLCKHWRNLSVVRTLRYILSLLCFSSCFAGLRLRRQIRRARNCGSGIVNDVAHVG